jgi:hypothetical protein
VDFGRPKAIKETRTKCVQTVFGAFRFRGRRYRACGHREYIDAYVLVSLLDEGQMGRAPIQCLVKLSASRSY